MFLWQVLEIFTSIHTIIAYILGMPALLLSVVCSIDANIQILAFNFHGKKLHNVEGMPASPSPI